MLVQILFKIIYYILQLQSLLKRPAEPESTESNLSITKNDGSKVINNSVKDVVNMSDDTDSVSVKSLEGMDPSQEALMKKSWWKRPDDTQWKTGQLAWAQVSTFPYWPCIITVEPDSTRYVKWRGKLISLYFS